MQDDPSVGPAQEHAGAAALSVRIPEQARQPSEQKIFCLEISSHDVAIMVRYRHSFRAEDTQVRVLAGVEQLSKVGIPPDYLVDAVDVIGTRWDGHSSVGLHRVVCLLERTPTNSQNCGT